MSRNRVTLEKVGKVYELVKADEGVNSCEVCAFRELCMNTDDGSEEYPCEGLSPNGDYYFKQIVP